jgi:hypothetical protein
MDDTTTMSLASKVDLPVSTLGMLLIFGPILLTWAVVELRARIDKQTTSETTMTLLRSGSILAVVLGLCYVCEHHFPFPHLEKSVNPTMYWGSFALLIVVSLFTLRKSSMSDFMHRDQTEEWKGWMQFLFLAYHYWKMESNYNDIRVYITCYLWMTGFGNFSFFYIKQDFTLIRVIQMVWRMNFFVFLLCMTMDNPYIVYYICPLHTFFFFVTYSTMALWSSVNRSEHGAAVKILVAVGLIYLVYDVIPQSFHIIFGWLGTEPTKASIGAHGVEWEWYFRSFLDHFSTVWGMVFAFNMPFVSEWFKQIESFSASREWGIKLSVLGVLAAMMAVWVKLVYMQDKNGYNSIHSYYGVIPLLAYLFLRNISVTVRSYYLHTLHVFGTITLESYLLQYHIWLADNAGKLLNIVPGYPVLNYCVATALHVFCAFQIFHATTSLRSILVPSNVGTALRNLAMLTAAVVAAILGSIFILRNNLNVAILLMIIGSITGVAVGAAFQSQMLGYASLLEQTKKEKVELMSEKAPSVDSGRIQALFCVFIVAGACFLMRAQSFVASVSTLQASALSGKSSLLELEASTNAAALFADSFSMGISKGFESGSLAQPWHGLAAIIAIALCLITKDPFFGLARLTQAIFGPAGQKSISWDQAYGPLLEKLGERKRRPMDAESPESQPLINKRSEAAAAY